MRIQSTSSHPLGRGPRLALLAGAALLAALCWSSCALSKDAIEERLLALPGNAPLRERGIERLSTTMLLEGERQAVELSWLRFPAREPRPAGERPAVVLVHGTPGTLLSWTELALGAPGFAGLAEEFDLYAIEVIGHGFARTSVERMSFQRGADYVAGAIEALGLSGVTLVGHSYGGEFCWRAALDRPDLVARLVLLDSSGYARASEEFLPEEVEMRESSLAKLGYLVNSRSRIARALQPHFAEPVSEEAVEEYWLTCENRDNWRAMIDLARDEEGRRQAEIPALRQPVLLLWGARDIAYPPERFLARFRRDLPHARVALLEGLGHYPQDERPAEVARLIQSFVTEVD